MVLAQELPDILHQLQFGKIGRRLEQTDIAWDPQRIACGLFEPFTESKSLKKVVKV
jgi:hypothetical protein